MTYAGQLVAQFTWDKIDRAMKQFDGLMASAQKGAERAAKNSAQSFWGLSRASESAAKQSQQAWTHAHGQMAKSAHASAASMKNLSLKHL